MVRNVKQLMEILAILMSFSAVFGQKLKINIYFAVLVIAELFLMTGINEYGFPEYLIFLSYIGLYVYCLLCYKETMKNTLKKMCLSLVLIILLQMILYFPVIYLMEKITIEGEIIINCGCLLVVSCFRNNIKRFAEILLSKNKLIVVIYFSMLIGAGAVLYQVQVFDGLEGKDYIQIIYFCVLVYLLTNEWQKVKVDSERKRVQLEMNRLYYDAYDEVLTLVRERQHDMKNHLNAILGMAHSIDNYDELVFEQNKYCNYILESSNKIRLVSLIENPLIAGFLYRKIQEAESVGIKIQYNVMFGKNNSSYSEYDIIEMLGILLDNAIEELQDEVYLNKNIWVDIIESKKEINMSVSNVIKNYSEDLIQKMFIKGYSNKGNGRGIGLSKLKRMVKAKQGEIIVSNEKKDNENYIRFHIMLPQDKG